MELSLCQMGELEALTTVALFFGQFAYSLNDDTA